MNQSTQVKLSLEVKHFIEPLLKDVDFLSSSLMELEHYIDSLATSG